MSGELVSSNQVINCHRWKLFLTQKIPHELACVHVIDNVNQTCSWHLKGWPLTFSSYVMTWQNKNNLEIEEGALMQFYKSEWWEIHSLTNQETKTKMTHSENIPDTSVTPVTQDHFYSISFASIQIQNKQRYKEMHFRSETCIFYHLTISNQLIHDQIIHNTFPMYCIF